MADAALPAGLAGAPAAEPAAAPAEAEPLPLAQPLAFDDGLPHVFETRASVLAEAERAAAEVRPAGWSDGACGLGRRVCVGEAGVWDVYLSRTRANESRLPVCHQAVPYAQPITTTDPSVLARELAHKQALVDRLLDDIERRSAGISRCHDEIAGLRGTTAVRSPLLDMP